MNTNNELRKFTSSLTVLYAEDDNDTRDMLTNIFSMLFAKVVSVDNGQKALDEYKKHSFDILITDLTMPVMDGMELMKNIRTINGNQKIVVMTAHNTFDNLIESINIQVDGILLKPIDINNLTSMLNKISKDIYASKHYDIQEKDNIFSLNIQEEIKIGIIIIDEFYDFINQFGDSIKHNLYTSIYQHLDDLGLSNISYTKDDIIIFSMSEYTDVIIAALEDFSTRRLHLHMKIDKHELQVIVSYGFMMTSLSDGTIKERENELLSRINIFANKIRDDEKSSFIVNMSINDKLTKKEDSFKWLDIINDSFSNDSIVPFYQPIYDFKSSKIISYSILARIKYNTRFIPPAFFIDLSRKAGILDKLSKIIFEKSFRVFTANNYTLNINIHEAQWEDNAFEEYLIYICKHNNISNERVIINVNDYGDFSATSDIAKRLKKLKSFGFKIAITNLNNKSIDIELFSLLKPDILRIDKNLLDKSLIDKDSKNLLLSILSFANSLKMITIAVGVENRDLYLLAEEIGFNMVQGYYISEPSISLHDNDRITIE